MIPSIMHNLSLLAIFMAFGVMCGFYLSVVGFIVSSAMFLMIVGILSVVFDGPFGPSFLGVTFIVMQVGFFIAAIASAIGTHLMRLRHHKATGEAAEELRAERDHAP